jgi:hypothetical protein
MRSAFTLSKMQNRVRIDCSFGQAEPHSWSFLVFAA